MCRVKQLQILSGVRRVAGTAYGGWNFYYWYTRKTITFEMAGAAPVIYANEHSIEHYSVFDAERMVINGTIPDMPVFDRSYRPMFKREATSNEVFMALAKYVPAVSSPVGGTNVTMSANFENVDMNSGVDLIRPNDWGRKHKSFQKAWLHSDMKDMAYFYVYKLYEQLITKGSLK